MHVSSLATLLITAVDPVPKDNDVKAGWLAFGLFLAGIVAVVVLGLSLVKQLRKAQAAKDAGVYGDEPVTRDDADTPSSTEER